MPLYLRATLLRGVSLTAVMGDGGAGGPIPTGIGSGRQPAGRY
jgi:hypothetical protein